MTISKLLFAATLLLATAAPSLAAPQPSVTFHGGSEVELAMQCIKARITPLIKADRTTCEDVANNVVHSCVDGFGCYAVPLNAIDPTQTGSTGVPAVSP